MMQLNFIVLAAVMLLTLAAFIALSVVVGAVGIGGMGGGGDNRG
jgi:hypothetical protein